MNKEVIKAIEKANREKKSTIQRLRKWWGHNGYKVLRVVLFPLYFAQIGYDKYNKWRNNQIFWDENRAKEILDYYIPRKAKWDKAENSFYFFDNGYGWSLSFAKRFLKRKDRRFWRWNTGWSGGEFRLYLIEDYNLEGFTKKIGNCDQGWTEIIFVKNCEE